MPPHFTVLETDLPDVLLIEPRVFADDRGIFFESWNSREFAEIIGEDVEFVQDNHSRSEKGVVRGLHYQLPPHAQGKLVRVVHGTALDVAVDIRTSSPNFGKWTAVELSELNHLQMWVPPGFAHGFLAVTAVVDVLYKATSYYAPESDRSIRFDDPDIAIDWPLAAAPILSEKDRAAPVLADAEVFD